MQKHTSVDRTAIVTFDSLAYGGDAVGHIDGRVVFVPDGAPGDRATITINEDKGSFLRGVIHNIESPSPDRTEHFCSLANRCGGCQWQHISYNTQLTWKKTIVAETLKRIAGIESVEIDPCLPAPVDRAYRSVARFPSYEVEGKLVMGYHERGSRRIVDIARCPVSSQVLDDAYIRVREMLEKESPLAPVAELTIQASGNTDSLLVELLLRKPHDMERLAEAIAKLSPGHTGVSVRLRGPKGIAKPVARYGKRGRSERIGDAAFRISGGSFFQVNIPQTERLVGIIRDMLTDVETGTVIDGYGGVGLFSFTVFTTETDITLFDIAGRAVDDSIFNAKQNGYTYFRGIRGGIDEALAVCPDPDVILLDPPRDGIGRDTAEKVIAKGIPTIVYVSCNPTTLARDLAVLLKGGYRVERVVPVDMFPQTFHIETVVKLVK